MAEKDEKALLREKLAEVFQLDRGDLDFGIYRILNIRAREIRRFLDDELIPQVRAALDESETVHSADLDRELEKTAKTAKDIGALPESSERYQSLRKEKLRLERIHADKDAAEREVYSHLYNFFGRYYREGDFLSLRRYQKDVYALPYEGEEVKLHWANRDQYYIKSSERFGRYAFAAGEVGRMAFEMIAAETERDNNKAQKARHFALADENPVRVEGKTATARFQYRANGSGEKQDAINAKTAAAILEALPQEWRDALAQSAPTDKNPQRTLLDKHLAAYTAKNTFDYFIHKDLRGFLRRELDFFIKNEVVRLDDIENEGGFIVAQYLGKVAALRKVGHKLIDFLAQLENFQKTLWEKRKFVLETQWCVTLDRVAATPAAAELLAAILDNKAQRAEWKKLFDFETPAAVSAAAAGDKMRGDFAKDNPHLVVDTRHFDAAFKEKLLASIGDIDAQCDGVLIHGDNFHALNLLGEKYRERVKCVYIDPPYNTNTSEILYKNGYKHSSWLCLIESRLFVTLPLLLDKGVCAVAIDQAEQERLGLLLGSIFPDDFKKTCVTVVHNPSGQQSDNFSLCHEFVYFLYPSRSRVIGLQDRKSNADVRSFRDVSTGNHLREDAANCFYPIIIKDGKIIEFGDVCPSDFHPSSANVIRADGAIEVYPIDPNNVERKWVFARDTVEKITNELHPEFSGRRNLWDIIRTKKKFNYKTVWEYEEEIPLVWSDKIFSANSYGTVVLNQMMGQKDIFPFPKSIYTVTDSLKSGCGTSNAAIILDYFAGSGTTAHAVINLNRDDGGQRKYILAESGEYFDDVLLPRIKKAVYAKEWKDGKPKADADRNGVSHLLKYQRIESYDDALDNLAVVRTDAQQKALDDNPALREEHILSYLLDVETRDSASLLNAERFAEPFNYRLKIAGNGGGEPQDIAVDLPETFNYLIGLNVKTMRRLKDVLCVCGETRDGKKTAVLWRDAAKTPNDKLQKWFDKHGGQFGDCELLYVNGDNPLPGARLIEMEFRRRMFAEPGL